MTCRSSPGWFMMCLAVLLMACTALRAVAATPAEVDQAVNKGREFLYGQQRNGNWEVATGDVDVTPKGNHRGGLTALAVYAILASGENPQNPKLVPAINFLKTADMPSIYSLGIRAQVWHLLPQSAETKKLARRDADLIIKQIKGGADARGLFYYPNTPDNQYDLSISQYGVLGLWACEQAGAEVKGAVWEEMDKAWRARQFKEGAWPYQTGAEGPNGTALPTMTAAGIATLFITHDYVRAKDYLGCAGNKEDVNIAKGLEWTANNFKRFLDEDPRTVGLQYYGLYGVERIGVAGGYKYFGKTDWFATGADWLIKAQGGDGSWGQGPPFLFGRNIANIPCTSFAMLFLSRGRSPVLVNKLRYEPPNKTLHPNWNQRPRDIANLTYWLSRAIEHPLNWQITNLDAPVDELFDAPVLYISGSAALSFSEEHEKKLKKYVEEGGMIVGQADCNSKNFATSFVALGQKLFTSYEFRELPDDHPIYTSQNYNRSSWKNKPGVQGLNNGTRELMLLIQSDPARAWQTPFDGRIEPYALGADILLYAIDKRGFYSRGSTWVVRPNPAIAPVKAVKLARLSYSANWDPEPGGWRRLAALLRNQNKIDLQVETVALGEGKLSQAPPPPPKVDPKEIRTQAFKRIPAEKMAETAGDTAKIEELIKSEIKKLEQETAAKLQASQSKTLAYPIAHLTGATKYKFSEAQIREMKDFIGAGGVLIVDCAGGSTDFADSVEAAMQGFGPDAVQLKNALPADHKIFHDLGQDLYRQFSKKRLSTLRAPRVRAMDVNNRLAVYYSPEDLSTGLVGMEVDGITGYTPDVATKLMRNILLNAIGG